MTELQIAELYYLAEASTANQFMGLSTTLFAYLVAGHFVARELSRRVAIGLTLLFAIFYFQELPSYLVGFVTLEYHSAYPSGWALPSMPLEKGYLGIWVAFPMVVAWIG